MVKTYPTLEQTFKIFFELFLQEVCYFNRKILLLETFITSLTCFSNI